MKKFILAVFLTVLCATCSFANEAKSYATTGIWELGGSIGFSGSRLFHGDSSYGPDSIIQFGLIPQFDYFIINGFHIGLAPGISVISYLHDDGDDANTYVDIMPVISAGYCFKLTDSLFFDLTGEYGFGATVWDNFYADHEELKMSFGLGLGLKIAVSQAIITVSFKQQFIYSTWDNSDSYDFYRSGILIGISTYL